MMATQLQPVYDREIKEVTKVPQKGMVPVRSCWSCAFVTFIIFSTDFATRHFEWNRIKQKQNVVKESRMIAHDKNIVMCVTPLRVG